VQGSKEESVAVGLRSPRWELSVLLLAVLSFIFAFLAFGPDPQVNAIPGLPYSTFWGAYLIFLIPLVIGGFGASLATSALGGELFLRREFFTALLTTLIILAGLFIYRMAVWLWTPYPVEGPLLAIFGLTVWLRHLVVSGIGGISERVATVPAIVPPVLGIVLVWAFLGIDLKFFLEGVLFVLLPLGTTFILLNATNKPMAREFGKGGVSILRPLFDHINERDPEATKVMEDFFDHMSVEGALGVSIISFKKGEKGEVLWVVPSVHPGPFADLGGSNLPTKINKLLSSPSRQVVVPHAPCNHEQNVPTTEEVNRVAREVEQLLPNLSPVSLVTSPLVRPYHDSLVRAQIIGDAVILLLSSAPASSDDVDYSVGEMIREEARRMGLPHAIVIDAHNSYTKEGEGTAPFGSPKSFKLIEDTKAAIKEAQALVKDHGGVRVGFAHKKGYTPQKDHIGAEGLAVTVIEAGGTMTAYALFDGNNMMQGIRDQLLTAMKRSVDDGEVMTTDNHIVQEVEKGINPIGRKRGVEDLAKDLQETLELAVKDLTPVKVAAANMRVKGVRVLGPGATDRLMTALSDSFSAFWSLLPTTFLLLLAIELFILAW
jgi:putative membrane protein